MERITLYEEYRFIEKDEPEVKGAWKGAHLLLFFLAFVFGSFCTFCFHMLMYLFDEKCVLFPKLLALTSLRQNIIYEFIPEDKESSDMLPVDFLTTQWVDKSACLLPTYVPLVSSIFGLVWTTMFLMCSTGSRVLTGLQRPWRVLPPVFLFSLAMGSLCIYTSIVTHYGLEELCLKLSEITGSPTCTYTVNVATLAYERKIRGVYQATRLTILSAWLHTSCWVLSALLAVIRVILAVDFQLIKVRVQLRGNIDRMLELHEKHIRTVLPDTSESSHVHTPLKYSRSRIQLHFKRKTFQNSLLGDVNINTAKNNAGDLLYYSGLQDEEKSERSLVPSEIDKLNRMLMYSSLDKKHHFIAKMVSNLVNTLDSPEKGEIISSSSSEDSLSLDSPPIVRQYGQQRISSTIQERYRDKSNEITSLDLREAELIAAEIKSHLQAKINEYYIKMIKFPTSKKEEFQSLMTIASDIKLEEKNIPTKNSSSSDDNIDINQPSTSRRSTKKALKSSLKQVGIQTDEKMKEKPLKVKIESRTSIFESASSKSDETDLPQKDIKTQTKERKQ